MPNPPFMTGVPELLILNLLREREEMYGYEIVAAIGDATGQTVSLKEGVVYPLLHGLEQDGVLKTQRRPANGRTRVYYALTSKGVRRLFELTDEWRRLQRAVTRALGG
ncbi:MAG TPA: PadR family transcriptional regulator [Rhizomicrobium sp.]|jgi:PadR family transcriptional regulator PadR|nr:PadR family transcriptional regulator [Rhizomicrobium sp.]